VLNAWLVGGAGNEFEKVGMIEAGMMMGLEDGREWHPFDPRRRK